MSRTFTNYMIVDLGAGVGTSDEQLRKLGQEGWVIHCPYPYKGARAFVMAREYTLTVADVVRINQPTGRARRE